MYFKSKWTVSLLLVLLVCIFGFVAVIGCGGSSQESTTPKEEQKAEASKEPIRIGMTSALTGPYSEYGEGNRRCIMVAVDQWNKNGGINGHPIELLTRDDQLVADKAVVNMKELLEKEQVVAVIGPAGSACVLATVPLCEAKNIPFINPIAQTVAITYPGNVSGQNPRKNTFNVALQNDVEAVAMCKFLGSKYKKIGIMHESTTYGTSGADIIQQTLEKEYGLKAVGREQYDQKEPDMTAQLARLQKNGADVVCVVGLGADAATIKKGMNRLAMNIPLFGTLAVFSQPYREIAGDLAVGTFGTCRIDWAEVPPKTELAKKFLEDYLRMWGHDRWYGEDEWPIPQFVSNTQAYDAAIVLFEAIKRANSTDSQKIIDELNKLTDYPCLGLNTTFTPDVHHNCFPEHVSVFELVKEGDKFKLNQYKG